MLASLQDILDTVKSNTLTYQQKLMCLGNIAERLFDPRELLGTRMKNGNSFKIK